MEHVMKEIDLLIKNHADYYKEKQGILDAFIRNKKGISQSEWQSQIYYHYAHHIALKNEVNEFINECRDLWKYWKDKPVDQDKLIDEFVDIIHFAFLIHNKHIDTNGYVLENDEFEILRIISQEALLIEQVQMNTNEDFYLYMLYKLELSENYQHILAYALIIIVGHYGYTHQDIKNAYDKKNKENFERQNNGW